MERISAALPIQIFFLPNFSLPNQIFLFDWYSSLSSLLFRPVDTVKTWFLRLGSTWGKWQKEVSLSNSGISVVNLASTYNLCVSKSELHDLLSKTSLNGIPLLVLGNKIDKPGALSKDDLTEEMLSLFLNLNETHKQKRTWIVWRCFSLQQGAQ